jgi:hypothetical protein
MKGNLQDIKKASAIPQTASGPPEKGGPDKNPELGDS